MRYRRLRSMSSFFVFSALFACAGETVMPEETPVEDRPRAPAAAPEAPGRADEPTDASHDDPGAGPTQDCALPKGELVTRQSAEGPYVVYVPAGYDGSPTSLLVGLHGCGDDASNFAGWAVNPWATRATQEHIGFAVGGESGNGKCWNASKDASKVLAAIDDIATCVYVHQQRVVLGGFSSGGVLAYSLGLREASRFAGILVSNAALSSAGSPSALLGNAAWAIHVAHRARTHDGVFPIARVRGDWKAIEDAGFPIVTSELPGGHDGMSEDWAEWLIPQMQSWKRP
jgi:predicted esterase